MEVDSHIGTMVEQRKEEIKGDGAKKSNLIDDAEMVIEASEDLEIAKSFDDLGLREELLRGKLKYIDFYRHLCLWI